MAVPPMAEGMKIVCLKSDYNNKYLRYRYEDVQTHGLLQFAADQVIDPYAQFEIVRSTYYRDLFHLKSRYNNKYMVRWSPDHNWIAASARNIDENLTSWGCTLFKPIYFVDDDGSQKMRLLHVQLDRYVSLWKHEDPFESCLVADSKEIDEELCDLFTFVNWESLFNLPKRVAFKGENGMYLGIYENEGVPYLQFSYEDLDDPRVSHRIYETYDGTLCIRSKYLDKFWRLGDDDWIVVDADDPRDTGNVAATFRPVVRDVNVVALLNMSKTWYCKRFTFNGFDSCLNSVTENVDEYALLEVIDLGN